MQFSLLIYVDQAHRDAQTPPEIGSWHQEHSVLNQRLSAGGKRVYGTALMAPTTATTVRTRNGESVITDGPFAETAEHLRGFIIVEAADIDEATTYARTLSDTVEIRPHMDQCSLEAQGDAP